MAMRYLVTGAAGFIGSHLVQRLLADGRDVVGVDNLSTGRQRNLQDIEAAGTGSGTESGSGRWRFIEGDLTDPEVARLSCENREIVLHQASIPSVPRSIERPVESMQSTVAASLILFEAARRAGVRRIVQASSSSVYGGQAPLPTTEDAPLCPLSPYAAAKAAQEMYARAYSKTMGLEVVSLRYFNVFGPRQAADSPYSGVIAKFAARMRAGQAPVIQGDGLTTRDFTYVDNVVDANLLAARHAGSGLAGEAFNIGSGERWSLLDLVGTLNRVLGTSLQPNFTSPRAGDARHSQADIRKAMDGFGYASRVSFTEGLERTVFSNP